ncbi:MAG: DNA damage-inducible protein D [Candidatus Melainabacteria bacterium RIFCSPLOWO2_02_FULL_35_15]|nr:MAG: DNA damage-inducible protein D [Candidatus Melainabacteria bacterium RIFCSPLOWO2_12_FULL_35_11]OGI13675.1 MAG: DNA damage-inducible protein D [Candidatus Melainabacteria bacterium RIFCSPLOWO2_02_FULL_35_15]
MSNIEKINKSTFETIKHINRYGQEYWFARELAKTLGYSDYRNFLSVIEKAKEACRNSKQKISDHFGDITEMVQIGSGSERELESIALSRYACYLIVQNADPSKEIIALGQTYFAVQTRKQEIIETKKYKELKTEEEKRLFLRGEMKKHNKLLAFTAKKSGVIKSLDYAVFQDHGYKGLYGGLGSKDIHKRKELKKNEQILDHMGSIELAANLFRATQTEDKLRRENIQGKEKANQTHFEVGQKVRKTIKELGGEMPENLPIVESIKKINKRTKKQLQGK